MTGREAMDTILREAKEAGVKLGPVGKNEDMRERVIAAMDTHPATIQFFLDGSRRQIEERRVRSQLVGFIKYNTPVVWEKLVQRLDHAAATAGLRVVVSVTQLMPTMTVPLGSGGFVIKRLAPTIVIDVAEEGGVFGLGRSHVSWETPDEDEAMFYVERLAVHYERGGELASFIPPQLLSTDQLLYVLRLCDRPWAGYEAQMLGVMRNHYVVAWEDHEVVAQWKPGGKTWTYTVPARSMRLMAIDRKDAIRQVVVLAHAQAGVPPYRSLLRQTARIAKVSTELVEVNVDDR